MLVYIPQSDEGAASWPKWFAKYPDLRLVVALSPHSPHIEKDPHVKAQLLTLHKQGRIDFALQIPNAPILPLLMDSSNAKESLPAGTPIPTPAYAYPDDVIQLIARSKAGFFKICGFLPHGLVVPYGAASPKLIALLERMGFSWTVAALGAPAVDGAYVSGPLIVWDATPAGKAQSTVVRVWDERQTKDHPLDNWMADMKAKNGICILPQEATVQSVPLAQAGSWKLRTWADNDWSAWIGRPAKNSAWSALRKTRELLEGYKNSGQASVQRLDVAFEELYSAQNSNYFSSFDNPTISPALAEEREHEFQATLLAVYRLIGRQPDDDLFKSTAAPFSSPQRSTSTIVQAERFPDGREQIHIEDAIGDALIPGGPDLRSFDVRAASDTIQWMVSVSSAANAVIDIYVDLNGQPNAGTPTFLAGRKFTTPSSDAWEYALSIVGPVATLYRTQGMGTYGTVQTFPVVIDGASFRVTVPRDLMRGSPKRWGYQVLVLTGDPTNTAAKAALSDFFDPIEVSQKDLWDDLSAGKRSDIPFVRVKSR